MKKKKERENMPPIELSTEPNGYALTVGRESYFYYNVASLVEGFIYHVGLHKSQSCDPEKIHNLAEAMATWPDATQATIDAAGMSVTIKAQAAKIMNMSAQLSYNQRVIRDHEAKIERLKKDCEAANKRADRMVREAGRIISEAKSDKFIRRDEVFDEPEPLPKPQPKKKNQPKAKDGSRVVMVVGDGDGKKSRQKGKRIASDLLKAQRIGYTPDVYKALITPLTQTGLRGTVVSRIAVDHTITLVGDAVRHPRVFFEKQKGCGETTIRTFETWISARGLAFGMDVDRILLEHAKQQKHADIK